ncbi:MAG: response regulator [Inquilinus limosus]|uniref:Response regulator n=1 Tax=Inquilinus limosus TaxID=171674 RepID=A0A952FR50_9PROT|nr:response regulator [Inquilinus limosus]
MAAILIVEDEPFVRMMAEDAAQRLGLELLSATGGDAAIALARAAETLAILFTDIHMPPGPDGWAVARAVREIHPRIRVIYTSGQAGQEDCARLGVPRSCLLPKPYSSAELAGAIAETVGDPA